MSMGLVHVHLPWLIAKAWFGLSPISIFSCWSGLPHFAVPEILVCATESVPSSNTDEKRWDGSEIHRGLLVEHGANWSMRCASIWRRRAGRGDVAGLTPLRFGRA